MKDQIQIVVERRKAEAQGRAKLKKAIEREVRTTFVGDLARMEKAFGHLWGRGKADNERTSEERAWLAVWERVRADVLDNGNARLRSAGATVECYEVVWRGQTYVFEVKADGEGQGK